MRQSQAIPQKVRRPLLSLTDGLTLVGGPLMSGSSGGTGMVLKETMQTTLPPRLLGRRADPQQRAPLPPLLRLASSLWDEVTLDW